MRRGLCLLVLTGLILANAGCFLPSYSSNPNRRIRQLLVDSENWRQIEDEVERFWFKDQPSHLTYDRIHGGLEPGAN